MKSDEKINYGSLGEDVERNENYDENFYQQMQKKMQIDFIKKVYGIVLVQLITTAVLSIIAITNKEVAEFQNNNPGVFLLCSILGLIIMLTLTCFTKTAKSVPLNYILLLLFTLCESYIVSKECVDAHNPKLVLMAACMTCSVVLSLTIYACVTETDYTNAGGILTCCLVGLIVFSIFAIFTTNKIVHALICVVAVVLFSFYLIYDTQLIMGRHQYQLSYDDYIIGAIMIYVDVIMLFQEILRLLRIIT